MFSSRRSRELVPGIESITGGRLCSHAKASRADVRLSRAGLTQFVIAVSFRLAGRCFFVVVLEQARPVLRSSQALPIATPMASTIAPPRVTATSDERSVTLKNLDRTKAMTNSSIPTTTPATSNARFTLLMMNGRE
jgi:hypothetical protein